MIKNKDIPDFEVVFVLEVIGKKSWFHNVWNFIKKGEYPMEATGKDKRGIRHLSAQFVIYGGRLYQSGHLGIN